MIKSSASRIAQAESNTRRLSVISLDSREVDGDSSYERAVSSSKDKNTKKEDLRLTHLDSLTSLTDIDACVDANCSHEEILARLESRWLSLTQNVDDVLCHLKECSREIASASISCLNSLNDCVDDTCDKVDNELKSMYYLITKTEELTTKLSVATAFREEIKTLKKSVDTLENLYKLKPPTMERNISS